MIYFRSGAVFSLIVLLLSMLSACTQGSQVISDSSEDLLTLAYAEPVSDFSPLSAISADRNLLINIYEPLLSFDASFNFQTALALSWGRLSDTEWEFRLRDNVFFHDGRELDADDVIFSLNLANLLPDVISVEALSEDKILIKTKDPDPLLLNKLTRIFIVPDGHEDFSSPIGTGPYVLKSVEADKFELSAFKEYWGPAPYFENLQIRIIPNLDDRIEAISSGEVQILGDVPPQSVDFLENLNIKISNIPALEASFLIFNMDSSFKSEAMRSFFKHALNREKYVESLGGGYLDLLDQLAVSGINGHFSGLSLNFYDPNAARNAYAQMSEAEKTQKIYLDLPQGLEQLGVLIQSDLAEYGFEIELAALPLHLYEPKIFSGDSDLYFFGWKYDLADSADFFESVLASEAALNGASYDNEKVNELLRAASIEMDESARRELLRQVTQAVLDDSVVLPLFESKHLIGIHPKVFMPVRLDGFILASEIQGNVLK